MALSKYTAIRPYNESFLCSRKTYNYLFVLVVAFFMGKVLYVSNEESPDFDRP